MMNIELSPRLRMIAQLVPEGTRLVDVGTDHAYLPAALLLSGRITYAIGTDLRADPVHRARQTVAKYALQERMDIRHCDGLLAVSPEECDVITIAGMGGETIAHILSAARWTNEGKTLILAPQSTQVVLRRFLSDCNYRIITEYIIREAGHWYPILVVQGGEMQPLSAGELFAGRQDCWAAQTERTEYLNWLLDQCARQLQGLNNSKTGLLTARYDELNKIYTYLKNAVR